MPHDPAKQGEPARQSILQELLYLEEAIDVCRATITEHTGALGRLNGGTGTAEVTGAPSHSWFIGFAPYGAATHRVAVAVILENAGYGGAGAAPAAGEIVAAAAALGLAK